ncbi:MAG: 6,7-dimethyl-8-ribityllumazine synthase [Armatimonadota bacterium]|nr:6,7-dimethyl-8-ribityllumazine synthase [bacterium]MDW8320114.1 6,7-dimethyl-8-ribityllumazine synthase [Armatimonadota bacterium]
MPKMYEGQLVASGYRFAIVVSRFNEFITSKLLGGALDALARHGVDTEQHVEVAWVPGSWEIPLVALRFARSGQYDAVICLGCVIRGDTPHFEYIAAEAAKGIAQGMLETGVPITFGVLTTDNIEQAIERAGTKAGNKGVDAAMSAIEMVSLMRQLPQAGR